MQQRKEKTIDRKQQGNRVSCKSATSPNHHNQATMLSLPRETRNENFAYPLAYCHFSILSSSRQLSVEALELIYSKAIFRVSVNSAQACHNIYPPKSKSREKICSSTGIYLTLSANGMPVRSLTSARNNNKC